MARSYKELVEELNFKLYPAPEKKYKERVLMVHFFGGNQKLLKRHISLLNEIGFDVYAFDLTYRKNTVYTKIPKIRNRGFEVQKIWNNEVQDVLSYVPGPVIFFSFSGPAACSIHAAVNDNKNKVVGFVSDSGPFTHLLRCNYNLAKVQFGLKKNWQRFLATALLSPLWNWNHTEDLLADLSKVPVNTPYLSIQPVKDDVVPVEVMADVFKRSKHSLKLSVAKFEDSGHLNALKLQPEKYNLKLRNWFSNNFKSL